MVVIALAVVVPLSAQASPGQVTQFDGDRYAASATAGEVATSVRDRRRACKRKRCAPVPRPRPGYVAPLGTFIGGFIRGRLICAVNVNAELARRGIRGTGSRSARDFLRWGRASGPVPGAVAVFSRKGGGHASIVHSVQADGTVIYLNPSSRQQAWQIGPYNRTPIAYRVAGG